MRREKALVRSGSNPPGNWPAPPGSNPSSCGGNESAEASGAVQRRDLADRARDGRLRPNDIRGAPFTISQLGMYHVNALTAVIVPQQAAILAVGETVDRVGAVEGKPEVRTMITRTLSCDHRVVDRARAAEFIHTLASAMRLNSTTISAS